MGSVLMQPELLKLLAGSEEIEAVGKGRLTNGGAMWRAHFLLSEGPASLVPRLVGHLTPQTAQATEPGPCVVESGICGTPAALQELWRAPHCSTLWKPRSGESEQKNRTKQQC